MPFYPFLGRVSPTTIDYRKRGTLILTSLLEDLENVGPQKWCKWYNPEMANP